MYHLRRKLHFVVMASVFDTPEKIHKMYDLKGSTVNRKASEEDRRTGGVLKDNDLDEDKTMLRLGANVTQDFLRQIELDALFLAGLNIMDYSLLVGVHERDRRNSRRSTKGSTFEAIPEATTPTLPTPQQGFEELAEERPSHENNPKRRSSNSSTQSTKDKRASNTPMVRHSLQQEQEDEQNREKAIGADDHHQLRERASTHDFNDSESDYYTSDDSSDDDDDTVRGFHLGLGAKIKDEEDEIVDVGGGPSLERIFSLSTRKDFGINEYALDGKKGGCLYFFGIIDILQQYNVNKRMETLIKGIAFNTDEISCVHPKKYAMRFIKFIKDHTENANTSITINQSTKESTRGPVTASI